jgi:DNA-binding GntR family transcriptional regulator
MVSTAPSEATLADLEAQLDAQHEATARQDIESFLRLDDEFHRYWPPLRA